MLCDWDVQTYDYWLEVMRREKKDSRLPKSGLKVRLSIEGYARTFRLMHVLAGRQHGLLGRA